VCVGRGGGGLCIELADVLLLYIPSGRRSGIGCTGLPPAAATIACSASSSATVTMVTASPIVPKRPVRPARCISVAPSDGSVRLA